MWNGRAAGFPLGSKVCTCIWDGSFLRPTVIKPGKTCSSIALPIVAEKLVLAAPCNGVFQVIMYSLTQLNSHLSIMYPRAIVPSALEPYPSVSGGTKCGSRGRRFVLEQITNLAALGGRR